MGKRNFRERFASQFQEIGESGIAMYHANEAHREDQRGGMGDGTRVERESIDNEEQLRKKEDSITRTSGGGGGGLLISLCIRQGYHSLPLRPPCSGRWPVPGCSLLSTLSVRDRCWLWLFAFRACFGRSTFAVVSCARFVG